MTVAEAAKKWSISDKQVRRYVLGGRIPDCVVMGSMNLILIPKDSDKPARLSTRPKSKDVCDIKNYVEGFITVSKASKNWNISMRRIQVLLSEGRISGSERVGSYWFIPEDAEKPEDNRFSIK